MLLILRSQLLNLADRLALFTYESTRWKKNRTVLYQTDTVIPVSASFSSVMTSADIHYVTSRTIFTLKVKKKSQNSQRVYKAKGLPVSLLFYIWYTVYTKGV